MEYTTILAPDGIETVFDVTFPFVDSSHVIATVNGIAADITYVGGDSFKFAIAPPNGSVALLARLTQSDIMFNEWADNAVHVRTNWLKENFNQLLYILQESIARADAVTVPPTYTSDTDITATSGLILVDTSAGDVTLTFTAALGSYTIKKISNDGNQVILQGDTGQIDYEDTQILTGYLDAIDVSGDATAWWLS